MNINMQTAPSNCQNLPTPAMYFASLPRLVLISLLVIGVLGVCVYIETQCDTGPVVSVWFAIAAAVLESLMILRWFLNVRKSRWFFLGVLILAFFFIATLIGMITLDTAETHNQYTPRTSVGPSAP
jgi:hypothetical protein